jgi:hypothetical protein
MPLKIRRICAYLGLALATSITLAGSEMCIKVLDEAGQPLPRARVQVSSLSTAKSHQRATDSQGNACFLDIPEGLYSVEVSLQGFLTAKYYPLQVSYPEKNGLTVRLPLSNVNGDNMAQQITLSGTLWRSGKPAEAVSICLFRSDRSRVVCTLTNNLGEYAVIAPPGTYEVELKPSSGSAYRSKIDLSTPGASYHDRLSFPRGSKTE